LTTMEWVDGFPADAANSEELITPRNGTSKARRRIVFAIHLTLPHAYRLVGLCRNPLHLWPLPARVIEVTRTRHSGLRRRPSPYLLLWNSSSAVVKSGFPGHRPTTSPLLQHKRSVHSRMCFHTLRSAEPIGRSRSARGVSHPLDGLLRYALAGLLHPAPDLGFATLHAVRTSTEVGGCTSALPVTQSPFEERPSPTSVPCHQGRFLLAVNFARAPPSEAMQCHSSGKTRLSPVWHSAWRTMPLGRNPALAESVRLLRSSRASTSRLCSIGESVSLCPVARTLTTCPFHGFDLESCQ